MHNKPKRPLVAVLLSGLVFPGAGHFYLQHPIRGTAFFMLSLASVWSLMSQAMQGAANILAQIDISSGVSTDQIARDIAQSLNQSNSASATFAGVVLAACWIIGIIDSYRLAKKKQDKQGE